ncbi:MAG: ATP-binding protein [Dehalococcoidia bacterium]|nr:ATP-binding protein [Dehalococcoidia bacterium]
MEDYEKLGVFYLGREYDLTKKQSSGGLLLYDSKDLVTHGVCVGMTGSGKTGLCISLLEEAALDNIPAIAIDPKGDLSNLLLTFPDLKMEDFLPWVNEEDARKKGLTVEEYAAKQASLWKNGLASWGEDGERIRRLRQSTNTVIYTPGSSSGIPVSIMKSFDAPPQEIIEDEELLGERINTTATSLLGIIGIDADPIKSREHILISSLLNIAWKNRQNTDISKLIQQIQTPPFNRIGVMDLDSFYPAKERFELALALNNLLAAPGFNNWLEGEALDINSILYTPQGKPKISIFSIAHLSDAERMFFVSLLLNQVLGWMRTLSGTTSLRAIVYMDEIFGFFPPIANPPSKTPLLTLLKQARAFGVGILLATQNPVDLDYKGLSNTGTWFIGRLQTERDKARVIEGLEGVAATTGMKWDRGEMEKIMAGLGKRVFLMNNVHDDSPVVFETRWAMSYLRGPLTRSQIKLLMDPVKAAGQSIDVERPSTVSTTAPAANATSNVATFGTKSGLRPILPPKVTQYFVPVRGREPAGQTLFYRPELIAAGSVHFADTKTGINHIRDVNYRVPVTDNPIAVDWDTAIEVDFDMNDLEQTPVNAAVYADLPSIAMKGESYSFWNKEFSGWLYRMQKLEVWKSPALKEFSKVNESERDFRIRLQQQAREHRDEAGEKLRMKYAPKFTSLQERLRRAEAAVEREKEQAKQQKMQTALSFGSTILGGFLGRKVLSTGNISRAKSTIGGVSRSRKEAQDIKQATDTVESVKARLEQLDADFKADSAALETKMDMLTGELDKISLRPTKANISIKILALGWLPYWQGNDDKLTPAW